MRTYRRGVVFLLVACSLLPTTLFGQAAGAGAGTVTGRVTDSTGAVIGGATVTLTDTATNIAQSATSNDVGLYLFNDVKPGKYALAVTKEGFRKATVAAKELTVGEVLTLDVTLEVGAATETVEVVATAEAELQTLNSTMGSTLAGDTIINLPTISRDVSELVFLQPTAAPTFHGAEGNVTSGNIAGNPADQNTYALDGGNNTGDLDGDNGTYVGARAGAIPTPAESVEEFRVNTNNMTSDFASSGGGQILVTTKRGTNDFHGSGYDFFQSDVLASNDWYNNFNGISKPKSHYNKFGGAIGGPMLPNFLGGKTYFYTNYEGERYPRTGPFARNVPSDLMRQGIIQVRDATGAVVKYDLKTAMVCGANGGEPCDPRGIGLNPVVSQMWNTYMPEPSIVNADGTCRGGDTLNTCSFIGHLTYPLSSNFVVGRIDHDFGSRLRWFTSYRYYSLSNPDPAQVDIGGLLPGDTKGQPAVVDSKPVEPRYFVTGLTATLTPSLTNEFHFNYVRNLWQWNRVGAVPQIAGIPAGLEIGGESSNALIPINMDTQNSRPRLWNGHDFNYRDTLSWLKGSHFVQFGGEYFHQWWHFDRYDNVVGGLTQLKYLIGSGAKMTPDFQAIPCSATLTTNCLPVGADGQPNYVGTWNGLYGEVLGMVAQANIVATRTGANLSLNPLGTPVASYSVVNSSSLYFNDAWRLKPNLTLNYGLNWAVQMPPHELNGAQDILVDANNSIVTTQAYLANRLAAANAGQVYNPTLGFSPVGVAGGGSKYPYVPFYGEFAPRVSIAWNPEGKGWLHKLLGDKATVIRGGYGRFYTKNLGIDLVSTPVLGDGFLNPVSCVGGSTSGACLGPSGVTPVNAFRIGTDGNVAPLPAIPQTLQSPVLPGVNAAYENLSFYLDSAFKPGSTDQIDFSIQRQLKGNVILEVGYVGIWARKLYQGLDLNDVPFMMKLNGQTFAQAYDNMYFALAAGKTPGPQPFFEAALKGSRYCTGSPNCTAAVAANESGNILGQYVTSLWSDLDSSFVFGPALPQTNQAGSFYGNTSTGFSNYQALVVTATKRYSQGLTLNANFTYGHSLGTLGLNQAYTLANLNDPWNLRVDYGPQYWDRKFTFNFLGSYQLPFGKGRRWANNNPVASRLFGGWSISPIFSFGSGLPLAVYTGSFQEFGEGQTYNNGFTAIPLSSMSYSNSPHFNVTSNGSVGVNGDYANGGSGVNLFGSNAAAVFSNFRPGLVGIDGNSGAGGILRGQMRWNLDLGLTKDTRITERVGFQIFFQAFNVLNHMQWGDPYNAINDPADFGVLGGQYGALTLGGSGASANYTRVIQLGLRVRF